MNDECRNFYGNDIFYGCRLERDGTFLSNGETEMEEGKACCFIGHRTVKDGKKVQLRVRETIRFLVEERGVTRFLFGSRSRFDTICYDEVTALRKEYPQIKRIAFTCKSEYACKEEEKEGLERIASEVTKSEITLKAYEDAQRSPRLYEAGKASYVERNEDMINASDFCVFYYDDAYLPPLRKQSKDGSLYQPKSGTAVAYDYAIKKKKKIINCF